jgi:hypothetical protein
MSKSFDELTREALSHIDFLRSFPGRSKLINFEVCVHSGTIIWRFRKFAHIKWIAVCKDCGQEIE